MTRENLIDLFENKKIKIAEIGVEYGGFTEKYYNSESEIHLIDMWETEGNDYYFSKRPGQVENGYNLVLTKYSSKPNVKIVKSKSDSASKLYEDEFFDWIYIDADHSYEAVLSDVECWYPKLKKGGIISGHDFNPATNDENYSKYGVEKAVTEFFGNNFKLTSENFYKSWYAIK